MARDLTIGLRGHEILGDLFRYGALTRPRIMELTGLNEAAMDRQLRHLRNGGLVARAKDVASWREEEGAARTGYYLTSPKGVQIAALEHGIENDYLSLRHYRRIRLPGTLSHRLAANGCLLAVREKAEKAGVEVPPEEVYCESWPGAPLFGTGRPKSDRENSPYRFTRIVPDGTFVLDSLRYYLEVETGTNARRELVEKLAGYAGLWRRRLRPNEGEKKYHDPRARLEPVVLLTAEPESAKRLQKHLRERLPETDDWAGAAEVIGEVSGGRADPRQLILLAGVEEASSNPLGRVYQPLRKYPETLSDSDGWRVSLADASAISGRIPVPAKPPAPEEKPLEDGEENVA